MSQDLMYLIFLVLGGCVAIHAALVLTVPWYGRWSQSPIWAGRLSDPQLRWKARIAGLSLLALGLISMLPFLRYHQILCSDSLSGIDQLLFFSQITLYGLYRVLAASLQKQAPIDVGPLQWPIMVALSAMLVLALVQTCVSLSWLLPNNRPIIDQVQMLNATQGWATGRTAHGESRLWQYQAGTWHPHPIPGRQRIQQMDMINAEEGFLLREDVTSHYRSGSWQDVPLPPQRMTSFDMLSANAGWAVGYQGTLAQYADGRWLQVTSPTTMSLLSVTMLSPIEGWAVGGTHERDAQGRLRYSSVILHYTAGQWSVVAHPPSLPLSSIAMVSPTEGWAVGGTRENGGQSVMLHYQNGAWQEVAIPTNLALTEISMLSADEGWAVGGDFYEVNVPCSNERETDKVSVALHYQNGAWQVAQEINGQRVDRVTTLAPSSAWLIGDESVLTYADGAWKTANLPKD